ncbi:hypothetical protein QTH91_21005 [Variovorax dokdonensis]|uniref:Transcriptional regulator n=1 Tax=Variovorax dokdonensis TaxID=344883 RepID=A0ABT7NGA7_9BURK|nr:PhaM family polyhydroxyalkanoate granule multifunctional regulatory protein [Variovorax dokdonensis]MDM0046984.1 hypothetical protein [Variovorax dokdonensis]
MSEKPSFFFDQFVPGFDFLKNLANGAAAGMPGVKTAMPGIATPPGLSSWVAPTLSVEEVEKRIHEMKAVQFWLEQNLHALKATIQALEVQKMTLSTLRGMNLQMDDLAKAFTAGVASPAAAETAQEKKAEASRRPSAPGASDTDGQGMGAERPTTGAGVVDPMKLWGALAEQFQQIAATALQEASNLKMPSMPDTSAAPKAAAPKAVAAKKRTVSVKKPASKKPAKSTKTRSTSR